MQSVRAMHADKWNPVASLAAGTALASQESPLVKAESPKQKILLNTIVKALAGAPANDSRALPIDAANDGIMTESAEGKPKNIRGHFAEQFLKFAHNKSKLADTLQSALGMVYLAGMTIGKPADGLVASARKIEQAVSTKRRFAVGAAMNSPLRMIASFLGISNIFTKNKDVGEMMYLNNASTVAFGDAAESALAVAKLLDKEGQTNHLVNGAYKSLLEEPKLLIKKIGVSLKELMGKPSLITNPEWLEKSLLESLINFSLAAVVKLGVKTDNLGLARLARTGLTMWTDRNKALDKEHPLRQHSATLFASEALLDALNGEKFKGQSTRVSSLVALLGQTSRFMGSIYQNPEHSNLAALDLVKRPMQFLAESGKSFFKYANPLSLRSKNYDEGGMESKYKEALGLASVKAPVEVAQKVEANVVKPQVDAVKVMRAPVGKVYEDMAFEDYGVNAQRQDLEAKNGGNLDGGDDAINKLGVAVGENTAMSTVDSAINELGVAVGENAAMSTVDSAINELGGVVGEDLEQRKLAN